MRIEVIEHKMEFKTFLRQRREKLGITQAEVANRLSDHGEETSSARVGHWETGRNKPPLEDLRFRRSLALALEMDVNSMMAELGYVTADEEYSSEARLAAEIVDQLPTEGRELAIEILRTLEKRFA
jgi:transcriptional regulator with XRE-family HTH domain